MKLFRKKEALSRARFIARYYERETLYWGFLLISDNVLRSVSSTVSKSKYIFCSSSWKRWQDCAICTAVALLSPVSIHALIPATRSAWIVSGTPACSRSSIAVTPSGIRSRSISEYARWRAIARPLPAVFRACPRNKTKQEKNRAYIQLHSPIRFWYFWNITNEYNTCSKVSNHWTASSWDNSRNPTTRTRRPRLPIRLSSDRISFTFCWSACCNQVRWSRRGCKKEYRRQRQMKIHRCTRSKGLTTKPLKCIWTSR